MKILRTLGILSAAITVIGFALFTHFDYETTPLNDEEREKLNADFVELKHGKVHYQIKGESDAPLVILVHGFSVPSYLWDRNYDFLVNNGYRVLRFDLYGRGFTDRPHVDYTLDLFVEQLEDLTTQLKINKPFHLVGISMGGAISTRFSQRHPEQIKSLSLLAPLVETPQRSDLKLVSLPWLGEFLAAVIMMPKVKDNLGNTVYDTNAYPEWSEKMNTHILYKGYRSALLSTLRYLAGKSFIDDYRRLGNTNIPTQLIWGIQDPIVPFTDSQKILEVASKIQLHKLDKSGHLPQIEHPEKVNQLLLQHINRNEMNQ